MYVGLDVMKVRVARMATWNQSSLLAAHKVGEEARVTDTGACVSHGFWTNCPLRKACAQSLRCLRPVSGWADTYRVPTVYVSLLAGWWLDEEERV